ncbi:tetratricopeptide repeat-containing diguanylate cyclase [Pseudomarimonas salicorniae]|uniref:diguanylate cyclase n=1 Tax=Pseudomarimonas salicorniae TaxID=2933270 RepID=A0ABT0GCK3_9GAMM|nr:GGDEF domain-containing protein [Lysobacter sp. CAU 1642]MCK7592269.1 GGDEF domain-containing protein [Lysobacter sp. CAU 1642]
MFPTAARATVAGVLLACLAWALPARAQLDYAELSRLPPFPEEFEALDDPGRLLWLRSALAKASSPAEVYRLKRVLFSELYYAGQEETASEICVESPPLREDLFYRQQCILVTAADFATAQQQLAALVHDARQSGRDAAAAQILSDMAWEQSKQGDIAAAFESYETALSIAPADDLELLSTLMMDTATNYIVNGDETYVRRGIELLARSREQNEQALRNPGPDLDAALLRDNILLTHFNTGIAYALHLFDYAKALSSFEQVNQAESPYLASSLTFSALSAAELGQYKRARRFLERVEAEGSSYFSERPVVKGYLGCYQQLTRRHWDAAQPLSNCLSLDPETTIEVQLDVYRRLTEIDDPAIQLAGLKALKSLFFERLEPQLRGRGSSAASNTELVRLQRESDLKSVVLRQQEDLQREREEANTQRQNFFIALTILLLTLALLIASQLRQKKRLAEQFERMSVRDALTQLGNRRLLEQQIDRELAHVARARRTDPGTALGIFVFDIDHFKRINDTYGHRAGDEVLVELARRVGLATRESDLLVRWGGEEFVFVARVDGEARIRQLAQRIVRAVNGEPFAVSGHPPLQVTCTVGAVQFPFIDTDNLQVWTRLVSLADAALYHGKSLGRNGWVIVSNRSVDSLEGIDRVLGQPLSDAVAAGAVSVQTSFDEPTVQAFTPLPQ